MISFYHILLDSFRMLKASMIFWITMGISCLVAVLYLSIGFNEEGISLFFGLTSIESEVHRAGSKGAAILYSGLFIKIVVGFWLSWIAVILALISCASIYPKAMAEGSAGMLLTKAPSRLMVFLAKFVGSLLFMIVQVGLFVVIVFLAMKLRLGEWNFSVFWFLPATVMVFAVLYSFLVLIAVKTRSTLTAVLLTMGLWLFSWIIGGVENSLYGILKREEVSRQFLMAAYEEELARVDGLDEEGEEGMFPEKPQFKDDIQELEKWYGYAKRAYAIFPKASPIIDTAKNALVVNGKKGYSESSFLGMMMGVEEDVGEEPEIGGFLEIEDESQRRHSLGYTLGTSFGFSFVMLGLAGWIFCRRDF